MVSFKISYYDAINLLNLKQDTKIEYLDQLFSYAKCEIEEHNLADEGYIKVDCKTSNRPDIWGIEGLTREISGITGLNIGLADFDTEPSDYIMVVDSNIKEVRPYIACSIIRNLHFDDFLIKQLIQLQEKVDFSFGRKRSRSSIGIYNINMVKSPIFYGLVPRTTKFTPLGYQEEMNLDEILTKHEKGIEYGHILPSKGPLPILKGNNGVILSLPPIINSNDVGRVNENTKDVLVEVTGINLEVVQVVNSIVTQALRDRGGIVYSVEIRYPPNHLDAPERLITPQSKPFEMEVNPQDIERYLALNLKTKDMIELLRKRRLNAENKGKKMTVKIPPYRIDILHWVDIAEEIAIAYGYMNIPPRELNLPTIGRISPRTNHENLIREILSNCALQEILNFTLTSPEFLTTRMDADESELSNCVEVSNPVSITYSTIRNRLLPGVLDFLSKNVHHEYPQNVYEVGEVVISKNKKIYTITKAIVALADTNASFELSHGLLDTLLNRLGLTYELEPIENPEFLSGRVAEILTENINIGIIGEISPKILENWQIFVPIAVFEIDLSKIPTLNLPALQTYD